MCALLNTVRDTDHQKTWLSRFIQSRSIKSINSGWFISQKAGHEAADDTQSVVGIHQVGSRRGKV